MQIQNNTELSLSIVSGSLLAGRGLLLPLFGHADEETLGLDASSAQFQHAFRDQFLGAIERRVSLTLTVGLTHPWVIYAMEAARARGYRVVLHHVGTADMSQELAGHRMNAESRQRVQLRWARRANLLSCAVARSDQSTLYDYQAASVVPQAQFESDRRLDAGIVVPWVDSQVLRPLSFRRADMADLQHKADNNGWILTWADLLSHTPHSGLLGPSYTSVVAQYVPRGVLVHDRAVLGPQSPHQFDPGRSLVVDYEQWPSGAYAPLVADRLPPVRKKTKVKAKSLKPDNTEQPS